MSGRSFQGGFSWTLRDDRNAIFPDGRPSEPASRCSTTNTNRGVKVAPCVKLDAYGDLSVRPTRRTLPARRSNHFSASLQGTFEWPTRPVQISVSKGI